MRVAHTLASLSWCKDFGSLFPTLGILYSEQIGRISFLTLKEEFEPKFEMMAPSQSKQRTAGKSNTFVWMDIEVELFSWITNEREVYKDWENMGWESCQTKDRDFLDLYKQQYLSAEERESQKKDEGRVDTIEWLDWTSRNNNSWWHLNVWGRRDMLKTPVTIWTPNCLYE